MRRKHKSTKVRMIDVTDDSSILLRGY